MIETRRVKDTKGRPPRRPISRILVANRGEIAARIVCTLREYHHPLSIFTLRTGQDTGHTLHSAHVIELPDASKYLDIESLVQLAKKHSIDAIHPGYGFLSESAEFARRAWEEAGAVVIGPGWDVLERTGDKLSARRLAQECGVAVLPGTLQPLDSVDEAADWVAKSGNGLPVMVKAADGGGGRGIRLVREQKELASSVERAIADSPSHQVFLEKAAVDGFRHIEVQIVGDGVGGVTHLWERECSIQRRYQKIVELTPSTLTDRRLVARIIDAALRMAKKVAYLSLGTFEFLANDRTGECFFLEVNPRLQVEHTITEELAGGIDVVRVQLELAEGATFTTPDRLSLPRELIGHNSDAVPPARHAVQLRITAEDPTAQFALSVGKIRGFHLAGGAGVRIETALVHGHAAVVSSDFDSLLAKIIVTAATWESVVKKAQRVLIDTHIDGIKTNLGVLRAIVASEAFANGACDTTWLESQLESLLEAGKMQSRGIDSAFFKEQTGNIGQAEAVGLNSSTVLFRKNDAWQVSLSPRTASTGAGGDPNSSKGRDSAEQAEVTHHLKLLRVLRNEFPNLFVAEVEYTTPKSSLDTGFRSSSGSGPGQGASSETRGYTLRVSATATGSGAGASMAHNSARRGDVSNPRHIVSPFAGKLVELLVGPGDAVAAGGTVAIVQQMKMELEVRASRAGTVEWVCEVEEGADLAEGTLLAELADSEEKAKL